MTIENAESFFAFDVVSYLAIFTVLSFLIIVIDKFIFNKNDDNIEENKNAKTYKKWLYFILFGRFNKNQKYIDRPYIVRLAADFFPVLLLVFVIRGLVAEPFRIPSNSMMPTFLAGDFIFVNKMSYGVRLPITNTKIIPTGNVGRGDVVVFRYPNYAKEEAYSGIDFIKRVVALPGDRIQYINDELVINGIKVNYKDIGIYSSDKQSAVNENGLIIREELLDKEYSVLINPFQSSISTMYAYQKDGVVTVPPKHYFVMGDNRANSSDSRFWGFVPDEYLLGKAVLIWMYYDDGFNFSRLGFID